MEPSDSEQTDALALCLILPSASREQAIVGDHRSVRACFAWTLLLAVLFMQRQGSPRALQRLWRDGCHLARLCCEWVPCWGVVSVDVGHERHWSAQLVVGQPARSHREELLRGSIINRFLRLSTDMDIHLVPRSTDV